MKSRVLFLVATLCALAESVHGAAITVTNTNDVGPGSLRQALADANDGDAIVFDASVTGTIFVSVPLSVPRSMTISGPGAKVLTVDGSWSIRTFMVGGQTVNITGLTIANSGLTTAAAGIVSDFGGGILVDSGGTLTVSYCTISNNHARNGAGIANLGSTVNVNNSTLSGNHADQAGGGVYNLGGTLTISNSTLSGNSAPAGPLGGLFVGRGGGLSNSGFSTVINSTFNGNSATIGAGILNDTVQNVWASLTIGSTILCCSTDNPVELAANATSLGDNLATDGSLELSIDPMLGPLQDNGGPTFTHALLPGSPAIGAGFNFSGATTDQRGSGFVRTVGGPSIPPPFPAGDGTDIGAFEVQAYAASIQQPLNADGTSVFSVKRGVVPVKFALTLGGIATCNLPPAPIALTRIAGGVIGGIDESVYTGSADVGSTFRISDCQYVYNVSATALGLGTYRVDILINGQVVGRGTFALK